LPSRRDISLSVLLKYILKTPQFLLRSVPHSGVIWIQRRKKFSEFLRKSKPFFPKTFLILVESLAVKTNYFDFIVYL